MKREIKFEHFNPHKNYKHNKAMIIAILLVISFIFVSSFAFYGVEKNYNLIGSKFKKGAIYAGKTWNFNYAPREQSLNTKNSGYYKIELWGASGGNEIYNVSGKYGLGGYTAGEIYLNEGTTLHVFTGEKGKRTMDTSFNGGGGGGNTQGRAVSGWGETTYGNSGGGATDIRMYVNEDKDWDDFDSLKSRIMVAAGGGGTSPVEVYFSVGEGSYAGGLTGYKGNYYSGHGDNRQYGMGGNQTSGGLGGNNIFSASGTNENGSFGKGGSSFSTSSQTGSGGGGGGYFGGGAGGSTLSDGFGHGAGGGSSYISGHDGCLAIEETSTLDNITHKSNSIHYLEYEFFNTKMIDGEGMSWNGDTKEYTGQIQPDGTTEKGHDGNGFAKITYLGSTKVKYDNENCESSIMDQEFGTLCIPSKRGFEFKGWTYNGNIVTTGDELPNLSEITLVSLWEDNPLIGMDFDFPFNSSDSSSGTEIPWDVPYDGLYKLEVWGASGASSLDSLSYGYGGYSVGEIRLNKTSTPKLYINIGGQGSSSGNHEEQAGGYNGGGSTIPDYDGNTRQASGGGATHIATVSGELSELEDYKGTLSDNELYYISDEILIVAGGGGGAGRNSAIGGGTGGHGGGATGGNGNANPYNNLYGTGGSQTMPGKSSNDANTGYVGTGYFGKGYSGIYAGAGGGFYGGGSSDGSTGGGSGYIANRLLTNKAMYCYNCDEDLSDDNIKTINTVGSNNSLDKINCPNGYSEDPISKCAKIGNGHVKITLIGL